MGATKLKSNSDVPDVWNESGFPWSRRLVQVSIVVGILNLLCYICWFPIAGWEGYERTQVIQLLARFLFCLLAPVLYLEILGAAIEVILVTGLLWVGWKFSSSRQQTL